MADIWRLTFTSGSRSRPLPALLADSDIVSAEQEAGETGVGSRGAQRVPHLDHLPVVREL